jgi:Uma2 family endonuclease
MASVAPERRHRLTCDEYFRMGERGVFAPEARVELINGEIIDMVPIDSPHSGTVNRLTQMLILTLGDTALVSVQNPLIVGQYSVPQPDFAVLRTREDFYTKTHPRPEDVLLVIEVADSSTNYDRNVKAPLYAQAGIGEYWLVDLEAKALHVFRDPQQGEYKTVIILQGAGTVTPILLPQVILQVVSLFY